MDLRIANEIELPKFGQFTPYQKWLVRLADSDYIAARLLWYLTPLYPQVLSKSHEAIEKYLKLLYVLLAKVPDSDADLELKKTFRHDLKKLREHCAQFARDETRIQIGIAGRSFVAYIEFLDTANYGMVARYPNTYAFPGNVIRIVDSVIHTLRNWCLQIEFSPVQTVTEQFRAVEGWPTPNPEIVSVAFHYQNERYTKASV